MFLKMFGPKQKKFMGPKPNSHLQRQKIYLNLIFIFIKILGWIRVIIGVY